MAETYCGKSCAECGKRNEMNCPGCKSGPGRQYGGDCELARCVREKGHETCETCAYKGNCGTLRSRDFQPEYRARAIKAEKERKETIARRVPVLGKWLWILFWIVIIANIPSLMTLDMVVEVFPGMLLVGNLLSLIFALSYGLILLKLRSEEDMYRIAGICHLIGAVVSFGLETFTDGGNWTLVISLPVAIVSMVGVYNEYMAHAAVLSGVDNDLSEKWEKLWKWEIGLLAAIAGSILVVLILPLIGAILALGGALGTVVVGIMKVIYLYRSANCFLEYGASLSAS